jgi:8-oxo-dGTP diphosphatase
MLVVVRHATAGDRADWSGDDRLRPLDEHGFEQARRLPDLLLGFPIKRLVASPYLRCVQTLEPLASRRGVRVLPADELGEDRELVDGPAFLESLLDAGAVACVHGGIRKALGLDLPFAKGEVWVFDDSLDDPDVLGTP